MGYNIKDITTYTPLGKKYLFDTNIWLLILNPKNWYSGSDKKYLNFFEQFQRSKLKPRPKIVLLSLILSEIINYSIKGKGGAKQQYAKKIKMSNDKIYFKEYRKTDHYKEQYHKLCEEIKQYHNYYQLVNDEFDTFTPKDFLKNPPTELDFNDHYYYKLAQKKGYTIVTHDGDFFVEDVEIITANQTLLSRIEVFHYKK